MTGLYDLAHQFTAAHPQFTTNSNWTGARESWNGWCQALMSRFDNHNRFYESAIVAARATANKNLDYAKAPVGAYHFWDIGQYGHVGQDLTGGGRVVFMASGFCDVNWGTSIGYASVHSYVSKSGAKYLGWAMKCGSQGVRYADNVGSVYVPASAASHPGVQPESGTWEWRNPNKATALRIQKAMKARGRYTGLLDGEFGPLSIKGIQITCQQVGYPGLVDGGPGPMTCFYVQTYAKRFGSYAGPIDKKLGDFSWAGFALGLERP